MENSKDYYDDLLERMKSSKSSINAGIMWSYNVPEEKETPKYNPSLADVSKRHQGCTLDNFTGNEKLISALREVKDQSVLLTGKTGCGKTHLATALMAHIGERDSLFITAPELLLRIRSAFSPQARETEDEIITKYSRHAMLVIDDLGAEKTTEYSITTLYLILDRRSRDLKQTIVTTNLSLQEIEETLGARIASRLSEMKVYKINMPDYRKNRS